LPVGSRGCSRRSFLDHAAQPPPVLCTSPLDELLGAAFSAGGSAAASFGCHLPLVQRPYARRVGSSARRQRLRHARECPRGHKRWSRDRLGGTTAEGRVKRQNDCAPLNWAQLHRSPPLPWLNHARLPDRCRSAMIACTQFSAPDRRTGRSRIGFSLDVANWSQILS